MSGPNEIQKKAKSHVFDTRQVSKPDLDLYDDQNRTAFAEKLVEKYVGKKWVREYTGRNKYEASTEMTFQTKIEKYDMSLDGQPTAASYVQDIENQQVENNHKAYKGKELLIKQATFIETVTKKRKS